jgi:hypothetical protein
LAAVAAVFVNTETFGRLRDDSSSRPHLEFVAKRQLPTGYIDEQWALDQPLSGPEAGSLPPIGDALHDWLLQHHAVQVGRYAVRVQLHNPRLDEVRIMGLRAQINTTGPAAGGTRFCTGTQGNGQLDGVEFDLDSPFSDARVPNGQGKGEPYFATHGDITLHADETTTLIIKGIPPKSQRVTWSVIADYTVGDIKDQLIINDNGQPFEVTGPASAYATYLFAGPKYNVPSVTWRLPPERHEAVPTGPEADKLRQDCVTM